MKIVRNMSSDSENNLERHYELTAQWISPQSQQRYVFKRRYYGSQKQRYADGENVEVLIDMQHPQRYYVFIRSPSL